MNSTETQQIKILFQAKPKRDFGEGVAKRMQLRIQLANVVLVLEEYTPRFQPVN